MAQATVRDLVADGKSVSILLTPVNSSGELTISWTLPSVPKAYKGAVVLLSETKFDVSNYPIDATRYRGSTAWGQPDPANGMIGNAQVVVANYEFFGDNIDQTSVTVTGLNPDKLYFASIHVASQSLQYYKNGVQSYLIDNTVTSGTSASGNIPTSTTPPENPTEGQTYYDESVNTVFAWSNAQSAWITASSAPILTSDVPYIDINQLYVDTYKNKLFYFDGQWNEADSTNVRVKMGGAWIPYSGTHYSMGEYTPDAVPGDFISHVVQPDTNAPKVPVLKFFSLNQWYIASPQTVEILSNGTWTPIAKVGKVYYGPELVQAPDVGTFSYNNITKELTIWTGKGWVKANTEQAGVPTYEKVGIGKTANDAARQRVFENVKTRLGYPVVCVELKEQNFETALDLALSNLRRRVDNAYEHRYIAYTLTGGSSAPLAVFYLNDPRNDTDRIVNVLKIHRINRLGISSLSSEMGLYSQAFFNQLFSGDQVDIVSIHLVAQLNELFEKIFAGNLAFSWNENTRELVIHRQLLQQRERVILEVSMERPSADLINDRWTRNWIQDWTYAECLEQLGMIRTKFGSLPSATGSLTLNGDSLLAKAAEMKEELLRQILDYEVGNGGVEFLNTAFIMG